jgi:hypothetical protein
VLGRGDCRPGDHLFLMTDALAQWFLDGCERGRRPWDDLTGVLAGNDPAADFPAWVDARRETGALRNDDVTLLAVGPVPPVAQPSEE